MRGREASDTDPGGGATLESSRTSTVLGGAIEREREWWYGLLSGSYYNGCTDRFVLLDSGLDLASGSSKSKIFSYEQTQ